MTNEVQATLFTKNKNRIFIYFPILLILISLIEIAFQISLQPFGQKDFIGYILSDLIFLNVVHNVFTIQILISSSNMQKWLKHHGEKAFWLKIFLGTISTTIIIFIMFSRKFSVNIHTIIEALVFFILPIHHSISQSMGLSFMYTAAIPDESAKNFFFRREKILSISLIVSTALSIILYFNLPHFFQKYGHFFIITISLFTLLLIFFSSPFTNYFHKEKFLFSMRYLLFPLSFYSPFAIFAGKAVHGLEYYFVTDKILHRSDKLLRLQTSLFFLVAVIILTVFRTYYMQSFDPTIKENIFLRILASLSVAFTLLHYYLDRILFQMKKPINKETTGSLLKI